VFPAFGRRVDGWFDRARRTQNSVGDVDPARFRRKCYGSALYHLLNPLRASVSEVPVIERSFGDDPSSVVETIEVHHRYQDLFFSVALGRANESAIARFEERYSKVVCGFLRSKGVASDRRDEVVDDVIGECVLYACNYFAFGSFAGWLWCQCMTYYRRWEPRLSDVGLHLARAPAAVSAAEGDAEGVYRRAIDGLTGYELSVLSMNIVHRKTLKEIAFHLDVDASTVSRHRVKAERRFRQLLIESVRAELGADVGDDDCRSWLLAHARYLRIEHPAPQPRNAPAPVDDEPLVETCPLVPCALP
jgi:DNA-directed RNA polymerase specialized sigma24 family protein